MKPQVTIITPTFNHEQYIGECIQSVLRQTLKDWEMIIIDDGSTDRTPDIIRRYGDSRIISIRKDHRGIDYLGENYNHALKISKGEYILILEGDDFIPPNRIELQLSSFEDESVVLSHGKYAYVFQNKIIIYPSPFKNDILKNQPIGSALKVFLHGFNPIGTQSVMIRKSSLQEIGGFTQPKYLPLVDYPTWMKLALRGNFAFIPEILGFWRRHPLSITINKNSQIFVGFIKYCDEFITMHREGLTRLGLKEFIHNRGAIAYLSLAWIKLSNKDWKNALELATESWKRRRLLDSSFRVKIIISIISAYLHLDIPSYFKTAKQMLYQKQTA